MIKKIISFFLGLIMFVTIFCITIIFATRSLLTGPTIINYITDNFDGELEIIGDDYFNDILNTTDFELEEYADKEEIELAFNNMITQYLKYYLGVDVDYEESTTKLKDLIIEACQKYENETGKEVDESLVDEYFNEIDNTIAENKPVEDESVTPIFRIIFSNSIIISLIIIVLVCAIVIVLLRGRKILTHLATILIFNALASGLFGKVLSFISSDINSSNDIGSQLFETISNQLVNIGIICLIVAIILIVANIIIKSIVKKKNITQSREESNTSNESFNSPNISNQSLDNLEQDTQDKVNNQNIQE